MDENLHVLKVPFCYDNADKAVETIKTLRIVKTFSIKIDLMRF